MIKAVGKRLVVKEIKEEESDKKGLIIPVSGKEYFRAEVIAIGSDVDCMIHEGDVAIIPCRTGNPIEIDETKYLCIYEDQILAILGKELA